ncbi:MAG: ABC transporter permease subunit [Sphingomonadales bacterium]|nr:ABC transporter permease subunit [Sphingomonadales bacterium]
MLTPAIAHADSRDTFEKTAADVKAAMLADPRKAIDLGQAALAYARQQHSSHMQATALWLLGEANLRVNETQRALTLLSDAQRLAERSDKGTHLEADILLSLGSARTASGEVALAILIGGGAGIAVGILLGTNPLLRRAYEPLLHYLGPTPKIIFFPLLIMWFGVGPGSKVAMGALSSFFPVAISVAAAMREINTVLIRVGLSFRLNVGQMIAKIYLPAMRAPVVNGLRIGLGVAIIGTLLAETKLANQGLGYAVIQTYATFDMPRMYALLIVVFLLAVGINAVLGRYTELRGAAGPSPDAR